MTADMSRIFFTAPRPYLRADRDDEYDVYAWQAGELTLVSQRRLRVPPATRPSGGPATAASSFRPPGVHAARDSDDQVDIYAEINGRTTLMTPAPQSDGERLYGEVGTVPGRNGAVTFTVDCGRRCDQSGVYSAAPRGAGARRLIDDGRATQSSYSPDGKWIAFVTQGTYYGQSHIWVMGPERLGRPPADLRQRQGARPRMAPRRAGHLLQRPRRRPRLLCGARGWRPHSEPRRGDRRRVPRRQVRGDDRVPMGGRLRPGASPPQRQPGAAPRLLAGGRAGAAVLPRRPRIAFISNRGSRERNPFLVYLIDRRGGAPQVFKKSARYNDDQEGPTFSPDGKSLLYEEYGSLTVGNLATGKTSRFPSGDEPAYYADWQSLPRPGN